jgi:hypothetical protein
MTHETQDSAGLSLRVSDTGRILIVSDSDLDTERLKTAFRDAGLTSESANSRRRVARWQNPAGFRWSFPHRF